MPITPDLEVSHVLPVISHPVVLLVEGKDEVNFFGALLQHMSPEYAIELREVGGKDKFLSEFPAFLNDPHFYQVKAYAIVRDADTSASNALKGVQKLLKDYHQPCPTIHAGFASSNDNALTVGVYIMPGDPTGMLEDLCLRSVEEHPVMPHVRSFMEQVRQTMGRDAPKNRSKATVQAFLAGMPYTMPNLGIAAQRRYWPFENGAFGNLRAFLEQLVRTRATVGEVPNEL
jgi:hypothetical protein